MQVKGSEFFMNKEKNLFSIGKIASAIGITRKIILNYEAKGLITPDRKEGDTGNRYYTIQTFTNIRTIRVFQKLGLSLDEIREYLSGSKDLQPSIEKLEDMRDLLNLNIEKLRERTQDSADMIKEVTIPSQTVYLRNQRTESIAEKTDVLRRHAIEALQKYGNDAMKNLYFIEYPVSDEKQTTFGVAVPAENSGKDIKAFPEFRAISVIHRGAYENIPETREKLVRYAEENGIKTTGICRHIYFEGPPQHKDKSKFVTQVILPIAK